MLSEESEGLSVFALYHEIDGDYVLSLAPGCVDGEGLCAGDLLLGSGHVVAVHGEERVGGVGDGERVVGLDGLPKGELRSVDLGKEAVDTFDVVVGGWLGLCGEWKVVAVCGGGAHVCPLCCVGCPMLLNGTLAQGWGVDKVGSVGRTVQRR